MFDILILLLGRWLLLTEIVLFAVFLFLTPKKDRLKFSVIIVVGGLLALIMAFKAGNLYWSPRPFNVDHTTPILIDKHVHDNGFPSSHGLLAFTLAWLVLTRSNRWGLVFLAMAIGVGIGRVLGKVHHPIDFVGSAIIAFVAVMLSTWLVNKAMKHKVHSTKKLKLARR